MKQRHYILGVALFSTIAASVYPYKNESVEIVEIPSSHAEAQANMQVVANAKENVYFPREWPAEKDSVNLFYVKPLVPVTPQANMIINQVVVQPPPQPVAPPLPFTYLGKMAIETKMMVYVEKGGRSYILKEGDLIDGIYEVKSIDAQSVVFKYIPLESEQILVIGSSN